jgi:white-opaque regulator 2
VRQNKIEDLFAISNIPVPSIPSGIAIDQEQVRNVFTQDYAPGLDKLLETDWYSTAGLECLLANNEICQMFSYLLERFRAVSGTDYEAIKYIPSLEAKVTWNLLCLPRTASTTASNGVKSESSQGSQSGPELKLREVQDRLTVFESLITGFALESNPLLSLTYHAEATTTPAPTQKQIEIDFWKHLGNYVSIKDNAKEIDTALSHMRQILHQQENRDVIYSIAIVRHLGKKLPEFHPQQAYSNSEQDDQTKLVIAKKFLEDEANNGMTQVISRLAGMAVVSWQPVR